VCRHRTIRHRSSWPSQEAESSPNTCLPKRKRPSSRRPLLVRCLCISLSTLCLFPCAMSICMCICMCHVYVHATHVCCMHATHAYCMHVPCASVRRASVNVKPLYLPTIPVWLVPSKVRCLVMTCQRHVCSSDAHHMLIRCLLIPSKVRCLLIKMPLESLINMPPHQDACSSHASSCLRGTLNLRPPQTLNLTALSAQPFFGLEK